MPAAPEVSDHEISPTKPVVWNNPSQAAAEFARDNPDFVLEEPDFLFNESPLSKGVTYYRGGYLKRVR